MKVLLTTLNSKFIHSSLAIRYLKAYAKDELSNIDLIEYTVNNDLDYILGEIYKKEYDIICFSCYIWNLDKILELSKNLKKIAPNLTIILGGPEVSYDPEEILSQHEYIDYIVFGEGEITFKEILKYLVQRKGSLEEIDGIGYRNNNDIIINKERQLIMNLDSIPFPYDNLEDLNNKIIYYESSRGCPFNCQYCLSSTLKGVRFFSIDRVKRDLKYFVDAGVKQVKFVDRTFNATKEHSLEVMKYLASIDNGKINFHFEITASLIDEEILNFLKTVRQGLFQFEVGIQSTNDETLEEIDRNVRFSEIRKVCSKIISFGNIHLHLDLIAGLPYEDYNSFLKSFDDVYNIKPNKVQLGFLKLLKGSGLRLNSEKHGYIFRDNPPYEVLGNQYINYGELLNLKYIEEMVEIFFNSHHFDLSLEFIIDRFYNSPSVFFEEISGYWISKGYHHINHKRERLYEILSEFYDYKNYKYKDIFNEILKFDYIKNVKGSVPQFFTKVHTDDFKNRCHEFLQNEDNIEKYLHHYKGMTAKQIIKKVNFETFKYDVLNIEKVELSSVKENKIVILFDYNTVNKDFGRSNFYKVDI